MAIDGAEWADSRLGHFSQRKTTRFTRWTRSLVSSEDSLDALEIRKVSLPSCSIESRFPGCSYCDWAKHFTNLIKKPEEKLVRESKSLLYSWICLCVLRTTDAQYKSS
jgi:hypothetical protein